MAAHRRYWHVLLPPAFAAILAAISSTAAGAATATRLAALAATPIAVATPARLAAPSTAGLS